MVSLELVTDLNWTVKISFCVDKFTHTTEITFCANQFTRTILYCTVLCSTVQYTNVSFFLFSMYSQCAHTLCDTTLCCSELYYPGQKLICLDFQSTGKFLLPFHP